MSVCPCAREQCTETFTKDYEDVPLFDEPEAEDDE